MSVDAIIIEFGQPTRRKSSTKGELLLYDKCPINGCGGPGEKIFSVHSLSTNYKCKHCGAEGKVVQPERMTNVERVQQTKPWRLSNQVLDYYQISATGQIRTDGRVNRQLMFKENKWIWGAPKGHSYKGNKILFKDKCKEFQEYTYIVEGEWDVFALYQASKGYISAVTLATGAGGFNAKGDSPEFSKFFSKRKVAILFDNDRAGASGASKLADFLYTRVTDKVKIVNVASLYGKAGSDVDQFLFEDGGDVKRIVEATSRAPWFAPPKEIIGDTLLKYVPSKVALPEDFVKRMVYIVKNAPLEFDYLIKSYIESTGLEVTKAELKRLHKAIELSLLRHSCEVVIGKHNVVRRNSKTIGTDGPVYWYTPNQFGGGLYVRMSGDDYRRLYNEIRQTSGLFDYSSKAISEVFDEIDLKHVDFKIGADKVNLKNGVIEYDEKSNYPTLRPSSPEDLFAYMHNVEWPTMETSADLRALERSAKYSLGVFNTWLGGQNDQMEEFLKMLYYIFSLDQSEQVAFLCIGEGANGKSTFGNMLRDIIGNDHTTSVRLDQLDKTSHITNELVDSSLNISEELSSTGNIKENVFKAVTGGSYIHADPKGEKGFSFKPTARWVIMTNYLPRTADTSSGYMRRLKAFKFHKIHGAKDPDTLDKLIQEKQLIFRLAMTEGRRLYKQHRFKPTKTEDLIQLQITSHTAAGDHVAENIETYLNQIIQPTSIGRPSDAFAVRAVNGSAQFIVDVPRIYKEHEKQDGKHQNIGNFSDKFRNTMRHLLERYTGLSLNVYNDKRTSMSNWSWPVGYEISDRPRHMVIVDFSHIYEDANTMVEVLEMFLKRFNEDLPAVPAEQPEDGIGL